MGKQNHPNLASANITVADKAALRRILEEQDKQTGFVVDANVMPQKARELMIAQGVRPEDNAFSLEIKRLRGGE